MNLTKSIIDCRKLLAQRGPSTHESNFQPLVKPSRLVMLEIRPKWRKEALETIHLPCGRFSKPRRLRTLLQGERLLRVRELRCLHLRSSLPQTGNPIRKLKPNRPQCPVANHSLCTGEPSRRSSNSENRSATSACKGKLILPSNIDRHRHSCAEASSIDVAI